MTLTTSVFHFLVFQEMKVSFEKFESFYYKYVYSVVFFAHGSYAFYPVFCALLDLTEDFSCEIEPDGKILIKGTTTTGEKTVCKHNQVFKMLSQNLCPPGRFTISFQLPGPVSSEEFNGNFGSDGVLEGVVKKVYYED